MNSRDFAEAGVVFEIRGPHYAISGPDDAALMGKLREAIARRVDAFRGQPRRIGGSRLPTAPTAPTWGVCQQCGDPLPRYKSASCMLCNIANIKGATP